MILGYFYSSKGGVKKIAKGALVVMKRQKVDKLYKLVWNKVVGGVLVTRWHKIMAYGTCSYW